MTAGHAAKVIVVSMVSGWIAGLVLLYLCVSFMDLN